MVTAWQLRLSKGMSAAIYRQLWRRHVTEKQWRVHLLEAQSAQSGAVAASGPGMGCLQPL